MKRFPHLSACMLFLACTDPGQNEDPPASRTAQVHQTAQAYFDTFSERSDWNKLLSFYREDLQFEDVMLQLQLDSLWQFKRFYKWDDEGDDFQKLSPDQDHLTIISLAANDSIAVATGRVNPFYYYGALIDVPWGMNFTIWLYFDKDLKIYKQVDWMEYDPKTLETVIKRCEQFGHEATPAWLDLSRDPAD